METPLPACIMPRPPSLLPPVMVPASVLRRFLQLLLPLPVLLLRLELVHHDHHEACCYCYPCRRRRRHCCYHDTPSIRANYA